MSIVASKDAESWINGFREAFNAKKLLTCPFCGSEPIIIMSFNLSYPEVSPEYRIMCDDCSHVKLDGYSDLDNTIEHWNERVLERKS